TGCLSAFPSTFSLVARHANPSRQAPPAWMATFGSLYHFRVSIRIPVPLLYPLVDLFIRAIDLVVCVSR
ncbi:unnamed protein product, partial [Urochloa humidicola]